MFYLGGVLGTKISVPVFLTFTDFQMGCQKVPKSEFQIQCYNSSFQFFFSIISWNISFGYRFFLILITPIF